MEGIRLRQNNNIFYYICVKLHDKLSQTDQFTFANLF